jgi:hypothetical protein
MQGGASTGAERTVSYVSTEAQRQRRSSVTDECCFPRWPFMDRLLGCPLAGGHRAHRQGVDLALHF